MGTKNTNKTMIYFVIFTIAFSYFVSATINPINPKDQKAKKAAPAAKPEKTLKKSPNGAAPLPLKPQAKKAETPAINKKTVDAKRPRTPGPKGTRENRKDNKKAQPKKQIVMNAPVKPTNKKSPAKNNLIKKNEKKNPLVKKATPPMKKDEKKNPMKPNQKAADKKKPMEKKATPPMKKNAKKMPMDPKKKTSSQKNATNGP